MQPLLFFSSPPFHLLALSFSPFLSLGYCDFGASRAQETCLLTPFTQMNANFFGFVFKKSVRCMYLCICSRVWPAAWLSLTSKTIEVCATHDQRLTIHKPRRTTPTHHSCRRRAHDARHTQPRDLATLFTISIVKVKVKVIGLVHPFSFLVEARQPARLIFFIGFVVKFPWPIEAFSIWFSLAL